MVTPTACTHSCVLSAGEWRATDPLTPWVHRCVVAMCLCVYSLYPPLRHSLYSSA